MIRIVEVVVFIVLMFISFFLGVKNSDSVKERASWLFEDKEQEIELPNLSNDSNIEITAPGSYQQDRKKNENFDVELKEDDSEIEIKEDNQN